MFLHRFGKKVFSTLYKPIFRSILAPYQVDNDYMFVDKTVKH